MNPFSTFIWLEIWEHLGGYWCYCYYMLLCCIPSHSIEDAAHDMAWGPGVPWKSSSCWMLSSGDEAISLSDPIRSDNSHRSDDVECNHDNIVTTIWQPWGNHGAWWTWQFWFPHHSLQAPSAAKQSALPKRCLEISTLHWSASNTTTVSDTNESRHADTEHDRKLIWRSLWTVLSLPSRPQRRSKSAVPNRGSKAKASEQDQIGGEFEVLQLLQLFRSVQICLGLSWRVRKVCVLTMEAPIPKHQLPSVPLICTVQLIRVLKQCIPVWSQNPLLFFFGEGGLNVIETLRPWRIQKAFGHEVSLSLFLSLPLAHLSTVD